MLRKKILSALCLLTCTSSFAGEAKNVAYQDKQVRISVVTDGVIRLEYVPDGVFNDERSFVAFERDYPKAQFSTSEHDGKVEITTSQCIVTYDKGTGRFSEKNLSINSVPGAKVAFAWHPGMKDSQNLKGTYRTLDGYNGDYSLYEHHPMQLEDGLLSRSGWTLIDDSEGYVFDRSDWQWVSHRHAEGQTQDWYFMAYGHDYKKALRDYTVFGGKVPMPPRFAFGYWWSRYWSYTDGDFKNLVTRLNEGGTPLDVAVIDMDWHYADGKRGGWTGYTWNKSLFPHPEGFLNWLHDKGVAVTLNLHPADGVMAAEEHYADMANYIGVDPASKQTLEWKASDKKYMEGWYQKILHPLEKMGVDFWWLDWQQGLNDKDFPKLGNTWWINYTTFTDMERNRNTRPLLYHRWGGLGNHRYQIGFSGDAFISWETLDYQPYFNSTASNVLYGYWSHDIGGHCGPDKVDPEMYVRWMQFGALSPILRSHSTNMTNLNKEPWSFSQDVEQILRSIVRERYCMVPYIYAMSRAAYDTGVSLCRPMYYDYPEDNEAYAYRNEYMFGDRMLVSPITLPMAGVVSRQQVWLPEGADWYEVATGTLLKGGQTVERNFELSEYPLYVKGASILPRYHEAENLRKNDRPVIVTVYPGIGRSEFSLYEDNGNDKDYGRNYATTLLSSERTADRLHITIAPRSGRYEDMPEMRQFEVNAVCAAVPEQVLVDGKETDFSYDGNSLTLIVRLPLKKCSVKRDIDIRFRSASPVITNGLIGRMRHLNEQCAWLKNTVEGLSFGDELAEMLTTPSALTYYPEQFDELINRFNNRFNDIESVISRNGHIRPEYRYGIMRHLN